MFSAIVTAFLIRALDDLDPNYQQQSALLLHQLLNGRDPNLANISDPTILQQPTNSAVAVNCLWFASLLTSLFASLCAIICKGWLTEYTSGTNPVVGLLRACRRHVRFMALQQLSVHTLVAFLPVLLHSSVLLFFAGAVVYLLQMDKRVAIAFVTTGGVLGAVYFTLAILPFVTNPPFHRRSKFPFYRLFASTGIRKVVMPIMDMFVRIYYLTDFTLPDEISRHPLLRGRGIPSFHQLLRNFYQLPRSFYQLFRGFPIQIRVNLPEYRYRHLRPPHARYDLQDEIDTSRKIQEEAILWLSQVPLDPSESKALISSLALISSSRPHRFEGPLIGLVNSVLEASLRRGGREETSVAIDCVIVLGNIKFQSVVDRNSDRDHNVGGVPMPPSVAWAAQTLLADATKANSGTPYSDGILERLLAATAWLSPVEVDASEWDGREDLRIQDRREFLEEIRVAVERHVSGDNPLNAKVLITLIRGMHACIPRGDYGVASSVAPLLPSFCEDYASPWSEDEEVLRVLITYALDLLLPPERRKPLVERDIGFKDLASELVTTLKIPDVTRLDVAWFAFWLIRCAPNAFDPWTITMDIDRIWAPANEVTPEDYRERLNSRAICAFVTVLQRFVFINGKLPAHLYSPNEAELKLPSAALEFDSSRPTAIYAISLVITLDLWPLLYTPRCFNVGRIVSTLFPTGGSGVEKEGAVDLYIYSTLILLKHPSTPERDVDVEKLVGLIARVGNLIEAPVTQESEAAGRSKVEIHTDLGRARWKAIYLSALLFKLLPDDQREGRKERLRARVRELLGSGVLSPANDCRHCLRPLGMGVPESRADQRGQVYTVFKTWFGGFPFLPLTKMPGPTLGWETLQGMSP